MGTKPSTLQGGDTPQTAPDIAPDTLYFGHLARYGAGGAIEYGHDEDYYRIPAPPPGSRVIVSLDPVGVDTDLGLFRLSTGLPATVSAAAPATVPLDSEPLGDDAPSSSAEEAATAAPEGAIAPAGYTTVDSSTAPGTATETVSTTADGAYVIKVSGTKGSVRPYNLRYTVVAPTAEQRCPAAAPAGYAAPGTLGSPAADLPTGVDALFLVDRTRLESAYPADGPATFTKLVQFAEGDGTVSAAPGVNGAVVDLSQFSGYVTARLAADANPCSVSATNAVVAEIGKVVQAKLGGAASPARDSLESVVLVGSDDLLPFARVPDTVQRENERTFEGELRRSETPDGAPCPDVPLGQVDPCATPLSAAAYDQDVLTDDPYGDFDPVPWLDRYLYVPDVAVGRLVETPAQIDAALDQYRDPTVDGELDLDTAVTAGYGAWADGGQQIGEVLSDRGASTQHLSPVTWSEAQALEALFPTGGASPSVASINAHMDPTRLLAGNDEIITTDDFDADRLTGSMLFTLGCHAGLNLPDRYLGAGADDWVDTLAGRAVYVANTGYGYADGNVVGLTERLLSLYAGKVGGNLTAGQALMFAKQAYLGGLGLYTNYDEKVLMQATFYGLPMYRFSDPLPDAPEPDAPETSTDPATGLVSASLSIDPDFTTRTVDGRTYSVVDGEEPQATPDRPIVPRTTAFVSVPGELAHDALITELTTERNEVDPAIANPASSAAPEHAPYDVSSVSFPSAFTNVTGYRTADGVRQDLVLLPGRVDAVTDPVSGDVSATEERFTHTEVQVFYGAGTDHRKPTITSSTGERDGGSASFAVDTSDASGVARVVVLHQTTDGGAWDVLDSAEGDLTRTGTVWTGDASVDSDGTLRWITQVVDEEGNVAISTNRGALSAVSETAPAIDAGADAAVELGERFRRTVEISDGDSTRWTATLDTGAGPEALEVVGGRVVIDIAPTNVGANTATLRVCDDGDRCTTETFVLDVVANRAPYAEVTLSTTTPTADQTITASTDVLDADGDAVTRRYTWFVNGSQVRDTGATGAATDTLTLSTVNAKVGDEVRVDVTASDGVLASPVATASASVVTRAPLLSASGASTVGAGENFTGSGTVTDPDNTGVTVLADFGDGSDPVAVPVAGNGTFTLSHVFDEAGAYDVTVTGTDPQGGQDTEILPVTVTGGAVNAAPVVEAGASSGTAAEGATFTRGGSASDPDGNLDTVTVDYGDGTAVQPVTLTGGAFTLSHVFRDEGLYTVTVTATDTDDVESSDTVAVTVTNRDPVITATSGPSASVPVNASATVGATFTDAGTGDTHTATVAWGDGTPTSTATVTQGAGSGSLTASHAYAAIGTYTVTITVRDGDGGTTSATRTIAVGQAGLRAYGNGSYASRAGSYVAQPSLTGSASFSFWVSRVGSTKRGNVDFTYGPANLRFVGSDTRALALSATKVKSTYRGTLNGQSGYTLVITVIDGAKTRPVTADRVRVKITRTSTGALIYDNQRGSGDSVAPTTPLQSGGIVIP